MSSVVKIGIALNKGDKIQNVNKIEAIKDKGIINDRKFNEKNSKECQITLIEIENINYFNKVSNTNILPIDFRRNIITEGIRLNQLVGKEFFIGNVKLKAHDLCRPCKYLQNKLTCLAAARSASAAVLAASTCATNLPFSSLCC